MISRFVPVKYIIYGVFILKFTFCVWASENTGKEKLSAGKSKEKAVEESNKAGAGGDTASNLVGRTLEEAKKVLGKPQGVMEKKGKTIWLYPDFTIISDDGKTVSSVVMADDEPGIPKAKPPVQWAERPNAPGPNVEDIIVISNGGQKTDINKLIAKGKITIIDFYADWCAPCRYIGPELEKIARADKDVVLRKVDIVNWGTEVAQQYGIQSVPNIRIYNRQGQMVGSPTHMLNEVIQNISKAKQG